MQWDDSNDGSPDDPALKPVIQLPNGKPSPLRQYDGKRRRRARKWSLDEEETLRIGVERYALSLTSFVMGICKIDFFFFDNF